MSTSTIHREESESNFMIIIMVMITISCLLYNSYHMFNWLYNMHYSPYSVWNVKANLMGMAGVSLAFLEVPAAILLVNSVRLKDNILVTAMYFLFICLVCVMEVKAGMASQGSIYDQRNNAIASENKAISSLSTDLAAAEAKREAAYALATTYKSAMEKTIRANADAKYLQAKSKLEKQNAMMTREKTTILNRDIYGNSTTDQFMIMLFPLFLSIGAVISTIYTLLHIKGKLRVAAMSMENKMQQQWNSDGISAQANRLVVSPMTGVVTRIKQTLIDDEGNTSKNKGVVNDIVDGAVITEKRGHATVKVAKLSNGTGLIEVFDHNNMGIDHIVFPTADTRQFIQNNPSSEQATRYYQALEKAEKSYQQEEKNNKEREESKLKREKDYPNVLSYEDFYEKKTLSKTAKKPPLADTQTKPHPVIKKPENKVIRSDNLLPIDKKKSEPTDRDIKKNLVKSKSKPISKPTTDLSDKPADKSDQPVKIDSKVTSMIDRARAVKPTTKAITKTTGVGAEMKCQNCGKAFTKNHYKQKFCSHTRKPRGDGGNCSDEYKNRMKLKQAKVKVSEVKKV